VTPAQIARYAITVDTIPPTISASSVSPALFSPTGDGTLDSVALSLTTAGGATRWRMAIARLSGGVPGATIRTIDGAGPTAKTAWNGRGEDGDVVADGAYRITLAAYDAAGNRVARSADVVVDTRRPVVPVTASTSVSPNGDGVADKATIRWTSDESASGTVSLLRGTSVLRRWTVSGSTGSTIIWDGRTTSGASVSDGAVRIRVAVRDRAGNLTTSDRLITVDRTLGFPSWSRHFYPQDRDALAPTSTVKFRLTRSAVVSMRILAADGHVVRTIWTDRSMAAGTKSWIWDGRVTGGALAAPGRYQALITARSSVGTSELRRWVVADAFLVTAPASVPAGASFTLRFRTVEPLSVRPTATLVQAGRSPVTKAVTRLADGSYAVTFTAASGVTGVASVTISAKDSGGRTNTTVVRVPVAG
jgi:flagellar hook assembly protein FlgD